MSALLNLHSYLPLSRANGPGARAVVWMQGCTLGCPGCFNPDTHSQELRLLWEVEDLVLAILEDSESIEGVTVSGGEPLQQPESLLDFLAELRARSRLSLLLFSGYTIEEIRTQPLGPAILRNADVLIDGRYNHRQHPGRGLRGSSNQRIHLLTDRYTLSDFSNLPTKEAIVHKDGTVTLTGVNPPRLRA